MGRARPDQLLPSPPQVADDARAPRITASQRRAKVQEQARAKRDRARQSVVAIRAAARVLELGTPSAVLGDIPLADTAPPFPVHSSHTVVLCGGFAGCIRCGGVCGLQPSPKLEGICARSCPTGSRGPISRLVRERLPHEQQGHQGRWWPSGEASPALRRWVPPQQALPPEPAAGQGQPGQLQPPAKRPKLASASWRATFLRPD